MGANATLKSRQVEVGLKGASDKLSWSVAAFDIAQPLSDDSCVVVAGEQSCTRMRGGRQRHRGVEASAQVQSGAWTLDGGAQWLRARREGSPDSALNGLRPPNVPAFTLKLQAGYQVAGIDGLQLRGGTVYESSRVVLPDNSASIPGYARFDAGLRYDRRIGGNAWTLRAGIDNVFDRRAWKESPYEFSHAYLYPLAGRTVRVSLQVDL